MIDFNITSSNAVTAAQHMRNLDKSCIDKEYQKEAILWNFNVKHALEYYLSLANGKIALSPDKSLTDQLNETLLALGRYAKNMFNTLTSQAKQDLIQHVLTNIQIVINN
jgi:hypothetical protein